MATVYSKWYKYFNNVDKDLSDVLLKNECLYIGNIIIAKKYSSYFLFKKFKDIHQFITMLQSELPMNQRYYAVLTSSARYLYLDIDYKWHFNDSYVQNEKVKLIKIIHRNLSQFISIYGNKFDMDIKNSNLLIWDATRLNKFSLHIIDTGHVMHVLDIKAFIKLFTTWIDNYRILPCECNIDNNIYHEGYQLWRLPHNHNGDPASILKLFNQTLTIRDEITINCMVALQYKTVERIIEPAIDIPLDVVPRNKNLKVTNATLKYETVLPSTINRVFDAPDSTLLAKYFDIANVCNVRRKSNSELIINKHFCPIIRRRHNRNTARIIVRRYKMDNNASILYYVYICMKQECQNRKKYIYFV